MEKQNWHFGRDDGKRTFREEIRRAKLSLESFAKRDWVSLRK